MLGINMYQYLTLTILCCLIARSAIVAALTSPCPKIFTYEGEPENDRWYGVMTFSSNVELVGLTYKIQLDRPGHLLVSWDGEVRSEDNINFSVFDPNHFQRAREVVKTRIMVKFDPSASPPSVVKIIINGNTVCSSDGNIPLTLGATTESPNSGRPDPFSVDEEVVPEYNNRPNNNQNSNSGYEKNRPSYYETASYNGGSSGSNYNSNQDSGQSYSQNTGYQSNSNPSQPTNNKNSNNNPSYSSSQNYMPDIVYPANHQSSSSFSGGQPQWSGETQQNGYNGNRINGSGPVVNSGPIVTTLTLPNVTTQNKNNVDTIIQLIKTQLEQQPASSNNTVIVALVSPVQATSDAHHQGSASSGSQSRDSLVETTHRTTSMSTQSSAASKVRSTPTSPTVVTKTPSNNRNKD